MWRVGVQLTAFVVVYGVYAFFIEHVGAGDAIRSSAVAAAVVAAGVAASGLLERSGWANRPAASVTCRFDRGTACPNQPAPSVIYCETHRDQIRRERSQTADVVPQGHVRSS